MTEEKDKDKFDDCPGIDGDCKGQGGKMKTFPICLKCKEYKKSLDGTDSLLDDRDDFPCRECKRPLTVSQIVGKEQMVFDRRSVPNYLIYGCRHCHIVVSSRALLVIDGEGMKVL